MHIRNKKGLTLIELIVVIGIMGIVTTMIWSLMSFGLTSTRNTNEQSEIQNEVSTAATYITHQLKNAKSIRVSNETGYTQLNLTTKYPDLDSVNYQIVQSGTSVTLSFTIEKQGYSVSSKIILNNISNVTPGTGTDIWYQL